ncbi:MAG TPA: hypothetical protein V6D23_11140 [Candidatus Obscuribacterales bacterium]
MINDSHHQTAHRRILVLQDLASTRALFQQQYAIAGPSLDLIQSDDSFTNILAKGIDRLNHQQFTSHQGRMLDGRNNRSRYSPQSHG